MSAFAIGLPPGVSFEFQKILEFDDKNYHIDDWPEDKVILKMFCNESETDKTEDYYVEEVIHPEAGFSHDDYLSIGRGFASYIEKNFYSLLRSDPKKNPNDIRKISTLWKITPGRKTSDNPEKKVPPAATEKPEKEVLPAAEKPEKAIAHYHFFKGDADAIALIEKHCAFITEVYISNIDFFEIRFGGPVAEDSKQNILNEIILPETHDIMTSVESQVATLKAVSEKKDEALPDPILKIEAGFFKAVEIAATQFDFCPFNNIERTGTYSDIYRLGQSVETWLEECKKRIPKGIKHILSLLKLNFMITSVRILVENIIIKLP